MSDQVKIIERTEEEKRAYWQGYATALRLAEEAYPKDMEMLRAVIPEAYRATLST